jgi:hypothetical protein
MPLSEITDDNPVQSYSEKYLSVGSSGVIFNRTYSPARTMPGSLTAACYLLFSIIAFLINYHNIFILSRLLADEHTIYEILSNI